MAEEQKSAYSSETIISEGNMTADPKDISRGEREAVAFRIACGTRNWVGDEATFYRNVIVRNHSIADHILNSYQKGDRVIVAGRLTCKIWTDKNDEEHVDTEIIADTVGTSVRWHDAAPDRARRNRDDDSSDDSRGQRRRRRRDDDDDDEEQETTNRRRRGRSRDESDDEDDAEDQGEDQGEDAGRGQRKRRSSGSRRAARGSGRSVSRHSDDDDDDDDDGIDD